MNEEQAKRIVKETFQNSFNRNKYIEFIINLLNSYEESPFSYFGNYIPDSYKGYISKYERIGKYNDGNNRIDILIVYLNKETSIERARTMQRNFIAGYLEGKYGSSNIKNAALVAFVSPSFDDWRFSLVKMDYKFDEKDKIIEELSPARRWSFLVGKNEASHTAQSQFYKIIADDEHNPTLNELEKAFDIETVTDEFFIKYRGLFIKIKESLDNIIKKDSKVRIDFENKGVNTVDFAKKLLGQIIFLYFLQKKGWFGVERNADWGTGSRHFLRELFEKKHGDYVNFFNDILEPLFYDALSRDRSDIDHWIDQFKCKIPFLNGGLFEPINGYDWVHTDILLPDELFSNNNRTKEGDIGDGILDIFDRYNFTIKEDEPLEKEVAIDPELLGKAYEKFNAIRPDNFEEYKKVLQSGKKGEETKFNKRFGVYYTPREIVHYMCQQSLINYLFTNLKDKISRKAIEYLIRDGEKYIEQLKVSREKNEKSDSYRGNYKENKHFIELKKYANDIDNLLADIKVVDPAVGSGAFPVGMMTEIVKARMFFVETDLLNETYMNHQGKIKKRASYNFKRDCIENSLYGVDIDPGAVEIAKLRLWLSLVVDEEDIKNIKPLPNLDYRIMQGNSLISEFMGIDLDSEYISKDKSLINQNQNILIEELQKKKDEYLNETNVSKKIILREEIDDLIMKMFEEKIKEQKENYNTRIKNIENKYSNLKNKEYREQFLNKFIQKRRFKLKSSRKTINRFYRWKKD